MATRNRKKLMMATEIAVGVVKVGGDHPVGGCITRGNWQLQSADSSASGGVVLIVAA